MGGGVSCAIRSSTRYRISDTSYELQRQLCVRPCSPHSPSVRCQASYASTLLPYLSLRLFSRARSFVCGGGGVLLPSQVWMGRALTSFGHGLMSFLVLALVWSLRTPLAPLPGPCVGVGGWVLRIASGLRTCDLPVGHLWGRWWLRSVCTLPVPCGVAVSSCAIQVLCFRATVPSAASDSFGHLWFRGLWYRSPASPLASHSLSIAAQLHSRIA